MPDHFHALIRISVGAGFVSARSLGDAICAFKSRVVHEYIAGVKSGIYPPFPGKIWQRNFYEMIVRSPEAERNISGYIRMNPWRCIQHFSSDLRGMGNPALWEMNKLGILCSRHASPPKQIPQASSFMGGFHSPVEKAIFAELLKRRQPVIWCPAWGLEGALAPEVLAALEENRMLILEMRNHEGNLAAAEQRNRFVLDHADELWMPHVTPGGMLDRLIREANVQHKIMLPTGGGI